MMKSLLICLLALVAGVSAVHQTPIPTPAASTTTTTTTTTATPMVPTQSSTATVAFPQCIMVFPPLGMLPSLMRGEFHQTGLISYKSVGAGSLSQSMISVGIKAGTTNTVEYTYSVKSPATTVAGRRLNVHQTPVPTPVVAPTPTPTPTPVHIDTVMKSEKLIGDWHWSMPMHGVRVSAHDCSFSGDIASAVTALKAMGGGDLSGNKIRGVHPLGSFAVGNSTVYSRVIRASARFTASGTQTISGTFTFSQTNTGTTEHSAAKVDMNLFGLNNNAVNFYVATYSTGTTGCASAGSLYNQPGHVITQFRRRNLLVHQTPVPTPAPTPTPTPVVAAPTPTPTVTVGGYATGNLSGKFGTFAGLNSITKVGVMDVHGYMDVVDIIGRTIVITSSTGAVLACAAIMEQ